MYYPCSLSGTTWFTRPNSKSALPFPMSTCGSPYCEKAHSWEAPVMNSLGAHTLLQLSIHWVGHSQQDSDSNTPGGQQNQKKTPLPRSGVRGQGLWENHGAIAWVFPYWRVFQRHHMLSPFLVDFSFPFHFPRRNFLAF